MVLGSARIKVPPEAGELAIVLRTGELNIATKIDRANRRIGRIISRRFLGKIPYYRRNCNGINIVSNFTLEKSEIFWPPNFSNQYFKFGMLMSDVRPPSTTRMCPVMYPERFDARKMVPLAISSGDAM